MREVYSCDDCKTTISNKVFRYSLNVFARALCMDCQRKERLAQVEEGKYPSKLAHFLNNTTLSSLR